MDDTQKEVIEAFLQVKCNKGKECDGPWCTARIKIQKAFGYPTDWQSKKKIEQHHQRLKELTSKLDDLAKQKLSVDSLNHISNTMDKIGSVSFCLYDNYFKLPPIRIKRGEENFDELLGEAIKSGQDYTIYSESGGVTLSGGSLGSAFDDYYYSLCNACYPGIESKPKSN